MRRATPLATLALAASLLAACSDDAAPADTAGSVSGSGGGVGSVGSTGGSGGHAGDGGAGGHGGTGGGGGTGGVFAVAVGEQGAILHCSETSCTSVASPVTTELDAVVVLAPDRAYAVGAKGVALAYDGESWKKMAVPTDKGLMSITAVDDTTLYAAGQDGTILRYDGKGWTDVPNPMKGEPDFWVSDIRFAGPNFGLAVGGKKSGDLDGVVLRWDGTEWTIERQGLDHDLDSLDVASPDLAAAGGWATINEPLNLMTRDKQASWTPVSDIHERNYVTGISFASETFGMAVTDGDFGSEVPPAIVTWDGTAWTAHDHFESMSHVHLVDETLGYIVGWSDEQGAFVERWSRGEVERLPAPSSTTALWGVHGIRIR